ncbi:FAD-dependent oxidoreductase [Desulfofundulus thermobenzoicus]|uniref:FAD-dependent oxidoreductase n=1 Tax=Desulfofundulus thermobenzoicus TaxID=29376 RepID=A0A6N7IPA4_9FIRM|nr:FAD-dependent oxidoreductase [Desulfofundulus thermobenzoicus]MQL51731.1 FAD-dependent oxidoreductase [Desulfofundulus thermobenzoicus]
MRIAIIGAGVSGLACALELERHGITPAIFEQRNRSGEVFAHVAGILQLMNRPIKDQISYLYRRLKLPLRPLAPLKRIIMHTPNTTGSITGRLGYLFLRGQDEGSMESQLFNLLRTPVFYNHYADWREMARHYDYVVVADGTQQVPRTLGCWQDILNTWVRGATVLGHFDPHTLTMWLNTKYCRSNYAYLTPFNRHRASLVLITTDSYPDEIEKKWRLFWEVEGFDYQVVENFSLQHVSGYCYPPQAGNVLLAGNAGGFLEPFLGFGLMAAIRSGIYAARALARGESYTGLTRDLRQQIIRALAIRRVLNSLTNADYDRLVRLLTAPGVRQLIYNTNIDVFKFSTILLTHLERLKRKIRPRM